MHLLQPKTPKKNTDTFTFKSIRLIDWRTDGQTNEQTRIDMNEENITKLNSEYIGQSIQLDPPGEFFFFTLFWSTVWVQFRVISELYQSQKPLHRHCVSFYVPSLFQDGLLLDCLDLFDVNKTVYQWQPIKFL